jgi:hypothetical protein
MKSPMTDTWREPLEKWLGTRKDVSVAEVLEHAFGFTPKKQTNDEKRAYLTDLKREHLIDQVCIQEILPPEDT